MSRRDIEFTSEGTTLRGWFYPADNANGKLPTVVMAHGFSAVKEMYLDRYAEHFAANGLNVLVHDNKSFGDSDGLPRQEIDPWLQVRGYRDAITYACTMEETDPSRIGVWGSSFSGGHAIVLGAIDSRVKAVVSQVPLINGYENLRALVRPDFIDGLRASFDEDRLNRFRGEEPVMVPVVDEDPLASSALPTPDSYEWFTKTGETRAPNWRNEVTQRSLEYLSEYIPESFIDKVSPTPLLLMPAENDVLAPTRFAIAAYEKAFEPKKMIILPGGHFDAYVDAFELSSGEALAWFQNQL
ncbi:alpha/beta hydrolase [Brevibacterium daeguense]|uniref:Alpha/beta hydrolase n=1 Tax=Brevibacterium daeguense TaxID=909936 RepID=A0ABP8EI86_9MICO|nr:alpha/beta hydrolase [Brevibacterium daeguense]